mmetsp:Transcript_16852/g.38399  ORF Transcript_16852/g.38399 Transcript_16852/m.38399 type:complete len:106 (+) Transcript_16852:128-445(+)
MTDGEIRGGEGLLRNGQQSLNLSERRQQLQPSDSSDRLLKRPNFTRCLTEISRVSSSRALQTTTLKNLDLNEPPAVHPPCGWIPSPDHPQRRQTTPVAPWRHQRT